MERISIKKFIFLVFMMVIFLFLADDAWKSDMPIIVIGCVIGALLCIVAAVNYGFPGAFERLFEEKNSTQVKRLHETIEKQRKEIEALKKEKDDWGNF